MLRGDALLQDSVCTLSAVFVLSAVRACRCRFRLMWLLILIDPFKSR